MTSNDKAGLPQTGTQRQEQDYTMAFQAGYRRTLLAVLSRSHRYDLAEEVTQAAWSRAWERWPQCHSADAVPWVIRIALHMLCDEIRRSSRICPLEPEHDRR
jgi:DNA-directed RNA polymerase specialized sigma24 family protein